MGTIIDQLALPLDSVLYNKAQDKPLLLALSTFKVRTTVI